MGWQYDKSWTLTLSQQKMDLQWTFSILYFSLIFKIKSSVVTFVWKLLKVNKVFCHQSVFFSNNFEKPLVQLTMSSIAHTDTTLTLQHNSTVHSHTTLPLACCFLTLISSLQYWPILLCHWCQLSYLYGCHYQL